MKEIPGYDRAVLTREDLFAFRAEAERRGEAWELRIEGDPLFGYDAKEGIMFHAKSLQEAEEYARRSAKDTARMLRTDESYMEPTAENIQAIFDKFKEMFATPPAWGSAKGKEEAVADNTEDAPCAYRLYCKGILVAVYDPPGRIPGYDREPITAGDWMAYREEAERRGHVYHVFVDEYDHHDPEEGIAFNALSDEEAIRKAYSNAHSCGRRADGVEISDWDAYMNYPRYATHGYKLFNQGRLVQEYTPPTPEEVAQGKVKLVW